MTAAIKPDVTGQFEVRGYVVSEDAQFVLADLFKAMEATAFAYDMDQGGTANFDLTGDQVAAVLRGFVRIGRTAIRDVPFTNRAMAKHDR